MSKVRVKIKEAGDTIVEVLFAITVVSAVLGGAYATVNRSLIGVRQSQERGEALKIAEGQMERLRAAAAGSDSAALVSQSSIFCFDDAGVITNAYGSGTSAIADNPQSDNLSAYTDTCTIDAMGVAYHVSVQRSDNNFIVRTRWEKAGGGENQEVRLVIRMPVS